VNFPSLQYFDAVGWVFWPVKTVSHITYTVLVETLNPAQSQSQSCEFPGNWEIAFELISDLSWLGSGAQGAVFLGRLHGEQVAVKKVRNAGETDILHLRKLSHPNLIKFKFVYFRVTGYILHISSVFSIVYWIHCM